MAEAPEQDVGNAPPGDVSSLLRELAVERRQREALDAENARLQAQIESYAEDLNSLYQERHGRGRGGLSAELSTLRAELVDESARREVLGEMYQKSTRELRSLGDQLVTYGQDLAKAYKAGKKASGADRPVSWRERASAAALMFGMLGTVAAGLIVSPPALGTAEPTPALTAAPSPSAEIRVVSSGERRPDAAAAAAAAVVGTVSAQGAADGAGTATAVAQQVGGAIGTATALAARAGSSAATAAAAGTALASSAGTATAAAAGPSGGSTPAASVVAAAAATATAATGAARTAVAFAAEANATATVAMNGAATALAAVTQHAGTATAAAVAGTPATAGSPSDAATAAAGARPTSDAAGGTPTPTASPAPRPSPSTAPGPDLRPTVTALAGTIEQVSAERTVQAATAIVFAREASAVASTATAFVLTATAPSPTPTAAPAARRGPPRPLGDLERCSWEVPIPPLAGGRGYYVQFTQSNRATITVLWSHGGGAMVLSTQAEGAAGDWRVVAEAERGDVVASGMAPATYRVLLRNLDESAADETMVALFYDELALCSEPTSYPDDAPSEPAPATLGAATAGEAPKRPFLDCRPYVRAPYGFVQVHPRLWIDRARRIEGTMPVTIKLTGPGTDVTLNLVAGPGRRAERVPLTHFGRYQLQAVAEGVDMHENCAEGFWFERTNPALPTLPPPPE